MESDSTLPCTDEEGAKGYEIPDEDSEYETLSNTTYDSLTTRKSRNRISNSRKPLSKSKLTNTSKRSRPARQSRRPARVSDVFTDPSDCEDFDEEEYSKPAPALRTRTRAGYQNSQSSFWTLEDVMAPPEKSDALSAVSKDVEAPTLTPEQLEIRQRRIERRREAARIKSEKEMQETVERLLRINTTYGDGSNNGGKSRGRRGAVKNESDSEDSNGEKKKRNALHPSLPLDPAPGSIRFISSQRIQPHCIVTIPPGDASLPTTLEFLSKSRRAPSPPKVRLCDQCKSAPRKYACPKTGRSLCSLECYKAR